jgi:hypothetical protein
MDSKEFKETFILKKIVQKGYNENELSENNCLFDIFVNNILEYHDKPVHSLIEMRQCRKTKTKGDLWELFCKFYLEKIKKYDNVWLLKETPDDVLNLLQLKKHDVGIDIIACKNNKYSAVQCKFKRPREGLVPGTWIAYNCVNWKELSTFYALCNSTNNNNWENHIVMTNTRYVRHMGNKSKKDKSICYGTFAKLTSIDFIVIASENNNIIDRNDSINDIKVETQNTLNDTNKHVKKRRERMNVNKMRLARLKYFENNLQKSDLST